MIYKAVAASHHHFIIALGLKCYHFFSCSLCSLDSNVTSIKIMCADKQQQQYLHRQQACTAGSQEGQPGCKHSVSHPQPEERSYRSWSCFCILPQGCRRRCSQSSC